MIDLAVMTDAEIEEIRSAVLAESERRRLLTTLPAQAEAVAAEWRRAAGVTDGTAWRQPTGAHDAVPAGGKRVFEGRLWENTSGVALAHSPSAYPAGWTDRGAATPTVPDPGAQPAWAVGVAYKIDDTVAYGGKVYRVVQAHTSAAHWPPDQVASLYAIV